MLMASPAPAVGKEDEDDEEEDEEDDKEEVEAAALGTVAIILAWMHLSIAGIFTP